MIAQEMPTTIVCGISDIVEQEVMFEGLSPGQEACLACENMAMIMSAKWLFCRLISHLA